MSQLTEVRRDLANSAKCSIVAHQHSYQEYRRPLIDNLVIALKIIEESSKLSPEQAQSLFAAAYDCIVARPCVLGIFNSSSIVFDACQDLALHLESEVKAQAKQEVPCVATM